MPEPHFAGFGTCATLGLGSGLRRRLHILRRCVIGLRRDNMWDSGVMQVLANYTVGRAGLSARLEAPGSFHL